MILCVTPDKFTLQREPVQGVKMLYWYRAVWQVQILIVKLDGKKFLQWIAGFNERQQSILKAGEWGDGYPTIKLFNRSQTYAKLFKTESIGPTIVN